jgi:serine/threonine protein kinase/tetratricopeptide (TPR) repeat protein
MPDAYKTGELKPGMLIGGGKFALLRRIGAGGMGEVFEAEDTFIGRRVALKVLFPHHAGNEDMNKRLRREARAAASIVHPHVVSVYEFGQRSNGSFYIVQELLHGKNVRDLLQERGKLDPAAVLDIIVPIMVALVATHRKDIIHRDIKPENIFLVSSAEGDTVPKLIDFGISKMDTGNVPLTQPGVVLGTPLYMSPELILGDKVDARTDVWGIGAVMFEMLTGRAAFDAPSVSDVLRKVVGEPAPRVDAAAPGLPRELGDVVERALERLTERRHPTMRDFLRAVLAVAERHEPAVLARHAGLMAGAGLKSAPPPPLEAPRKDLSMGRVDDDSLTLGDATLESPVAPNSGRPIWPMASVEAPRERSGAGTAGLAEHVDAARLALRLNALQDAVSHAEDAIRSHGAAGALRGEMRLVQAIACRWLGDFGEGERHAAEAMTHLERGSSGWFAAAAHRGMVCGYLGKTDELAALTREILALGASEWNGNHVSTLCYLTVMLIRGSALDLASQAFDHARTMARSTTRQNVPVEPEVRAAIDLAHAQFALHAGDPTTHLRRVESALTQFIAIGDARNACLQRANIGNAYIQLGAYPRAEQLLREAIRVGEPMKLMFITPTRANLGFTLARLGDLDQAIEVERAALAECAQQGYRRFEAYSRIYLTEILSLRGDLPGAEHEARAAIEAAAISPAISAQAHASLASILLQRGQVAAAFEHAKRAMDTLELLDGVEEGEALIRIVYVMALDATERPRAAAERLAGARQRLLERVERIRDLELRKSFTDKVPENALTFEYTPRSRTTPPRSA